MRALREREREKGESEMGRIEDGETERGGNRGTAGERRGRRR